MVIDQSLHGILTVDLPTEPEMATELETVATIARDGADCDVVIDFSSIDIVTSSSIAKLLKLNKFLYESGHRLILCGIATVTKQIFVLAGLDQVFDFANDKSAALNIVKNAEQVKS
jgi:anti-anti-sigma factor